MKLCKILILCQIEIKCSNDQILCDTAELQLVWENLNYWPMPGIRAGDPWEAWEPRARCIVLFSIVLLCILLLLWGQCVSPLSFLLFLGSAPASLTIVLPIEYCTALTRVLVPGLARVLMPGLTRGCCGNSKLYNLDHWTYLYNVDHHSMLFNVHNVNHWISQNTHCCGNLKLYRVCRTCTICRTLPCCPMLPIEYCTALTRVACCPVVGTLKLCNVDHYCCKH